MAKNKAIVVRMAIHGDIFAMLNKHPAEKHFQLTVRRLPQTCRAIISPQPKSAQVPYGNASDRSSRALITCMEVWRR